MPLERFEDFRIFSGNQEIKNKINYFLNPSHSCRLCKKVARIYMSRKSCDGFDLSVFCLTKGMKIFAFSSSTAKNFKRNLIASLFPAIRTRYVRSYLRSTYAENHKCMNILVKVMPLRKFEDFHFLQRELGISKENKLLPVKVILAEYVRIYLRSFGAENHKSENRCDKVIYPSSKI